MEIVSQPNTKPKKALNMEQSLKNIKSMLKQKESSMSKNSGATTMTILQASLVKVQLKPVGSGHGIVGCANLSNGEEVTKEIVIGTHGLPVMPQLTVRDRQSIDTEIYTEGYDNPTVYKLKLEHERELMPVLIQMNAAIRVSPYEYIVTRLARLKTIKPTHNMDVAQATVFFTEIANMLRDEGFCYTAIDEGICELVRKEKDKWFPGPQKLIEYIYPIHWKMKRRADKLHEMLSRPHKIGE